MTSFHSTYKSSDNIKTRDSDLNWYGRRIPFNTSLGTILIFGKTYSINKKWKWFLELEYRMYNVVNIRLEDYEDYILEKKQKPWVLGVNLGIGIP